MRTARDLQLVATILMAVVLMLTIAFIPMQRTLKVLYVSDESVLNYRTIPFGQICSAAVYLLLGVIYLALLNKKTAAPLKISIVVIVIVYGLLSLCVLPLASTFETHAVGREGVIAIASFSACRNALSFLTGLPAGISKILMFLSMGGAIGKSRADAPLPVETNAPEARIE